MDLRAPDSNMITTPPDDPPSSTETYMPAEGICSRHNPLGRAVYLREPLVITIRYGDKSEPAFRAHKILLSKHSGWFAAALGAASDLKSGFAESYKDEITLFDDDPDAVDTMLAFCHPSNDSEFLVNQVPWPASYTGWAAEDVLDFWVSLYRTAVKYQMPLLIEESLEEFRISYECWVDMLNGDVSCVEVSTVTESFLFLIEDLYASAPERTLGDIVDIFTTSSVKLIFRKILPQSVIYKAFLLADQELVKFPFDVSFALVAKRCANLENQGKCETRPVLILRIYSESLADESPIVGLY